MNDDVFAALERLGRRRPNPTTVFDRHRTRPDSTAAPAAADMKAPAQVEAPAHGRVAPGRWLPRVWLVDAGGEDAGTVWLSSVDGVTAWVAAVRVPGAATGVLIGAFGSRRAAELAVRQLWTAFVGVEELSEIPKEVRLGVYHRDQGRCRRCGGPGESIHHRRKRRSFNPHRPSNLVLVCGDGSRGCHGWIERHPKAAGESGWSIRMDSEFEPDQVPCTSTLGYTFQLLDDFAEEPLGHRLDRIRR